MVKISNQAIEDLKNALQKSYGVDFTSSLSEDEVNEIGCLLLTIMSESLKRKITDSKLLISNI